MNSSEDPLVQKQEHSPRTTKTSSVLGVISIILALIALIITSCNLDGSMGEVLAIVLFAFPLMGTIAQRLPGRMLKWSSPALSFDDDEASAMVRRRYRKGWEIDALKG